MDNQTTAVLGELREGGEFDYAEMLRRTSALVSGLSLAHDIVISRVFVTRE